MGLSFPLAILDFEASGLGEASYPIEVGVAIARAPAGAVETWSTLIRPAPDWRDWDRAAQAVHGIARERLDEGLPAAAALARLNDLIAPIGHAWCDGGGFDRFWLARLCRAAPSVPPAFALWDVGGLFALDRRAHNRFADALARDAPPHRAGADAARVCGAIVEVFGEEVRL